MIGAIGALFLILMVVGSMKVLNTPVGQIELQRIPGETLPENLEILLDGQVVGQKLPLKIPTVAVGMHQVSARAGEDCDAPDFEVKVLEGQSIFLPLSIKCGADQVMAKPEQEKFTEWQLEIQVVNDASQPVTDAKVIVGNQAAQPLPFVVQIPKEQNIG